MEVREKLRGFSRKIGFTEMETNVLLTLTVLILLGLGYSYFSRPHTEAPKFDYAAEDSLYAALIGHTAAGKQAPPSQTDSSAGKTIPQPGAKVNLNTATAADLDGLPGIGPVLAGRIIEHRNKAGRFTAIEQIMDVKGIGEGKFGKIRTLISVK